jgi:hypothetical protein
VVGAIREGLMTDASVTNPNPDVDIYRLAFAAPIAPTTFTLTLDNNLGNTFMLVIADAANGRLIRNCSLELTACEVSLSGNVNLTVTGVFAGVYLLSITHGL